MSSDPDIVDMASSADEKNPSQPRFVGTTGDLYNGSIAETAIKEGRHSDHHLQTKLENPQRSGFQNASNHFKSAQWSPDGTSILTSSADNILRSFILPPDLLTPPHPTTLQPYAHHHSPEPVYAATFHPSYNLQEPPTCLVLASPRSLPIRLFSPFTTDKILASYPLVNPTTEAWISPHSLLFHPHETNTFLAGSQSCVSVFDLNRNGDGPVTRTHTTPSRWGRGAANGHQGQVGMKGIVSALGMGSEGILAAGTYSRWVGLYDGFGRGRGAGAAVFSLAGAKDDDVKRDGGRGITQLLWSACGRYLCVVERCSDGIGVWDIRGTGKRLAWLRGRNAMTPQRLSVEVLGGEVWAGGLDGMVRVWEGIGTREGVMDSGWEFRAHDDAVSSTTLHASGSVMATCSGQRHSFRPLYAGDDLDSESDSNCSSPNSLGATSLSALERSSQTIDNTLKLWAL